MSQLGHAVQVSELVSAEAPSPAHPHAARSVDRDADGPT